MTLVEHLKGHYFGLERTDHLSLNHVVLRMIMRLSDEHNLGRSQLIYFFSCEPRF